MRVLILGIDGYLGWPLACRWARLGGEVFGVDNYSRRRRVAEKGGVCALPIEDAHSRWVALWGARAMRPSAPRRLWPMTLGTDAQLAAILAWSRPQIIYHLAQMPSAPYSMDNAADSIQSYVENTAGNLAVLWAMRHHAPEAHLVKLGTMGEYGTPCGPIEEAPPSVVGRAPGSIYHSSKVADSVNCELLASVWGLSISDIMQGVVYGHTIEGLLSPTRLDIDATFGTVVNRFCAQAMLGVDLSVYGAGGQTRGYLPLAESIDCLVRVGQHPPPAGTYEVYNQFGQIWSVLELAHWVQRVGGPGVRIGAVPNPRQEAEAHTYTPKNDKLKALGYTPLVDPSEVLEGLLAAVAAHRDRLVRYTDRLHPTTRWR